MTSREVARRLVDLSVVTASSLVVAAAYLLVASVDRSRTADVAENAPATVAALPLAQAPAPGLVPATPLPPRRVIVVRRSRAS